MATATVATEKKAKGGPKGPRQTVAEMFAALEKAGGAFAAKGTQVKAAFVASEKASKAAKDAAKDLRKKLRKAVKAISALN